MHTTDFGIPVLEHWLEQEIAQWVHHKCFSNENISDINILLNVKVLLKQQLKISLNESSLFSFI